ncbi:MAG: ParB/RepB/Spo0J family partition protein [Acetanaerobacterium sp.]
MGKIDLKSKVSANSSAEAFSMLMGGGRKGDIKELPLASLVPFEDQPFHPYPQDKLLTLAEDIRENGVLNPILVRQIDEEHYQILAGHNRVNACRLLGVDAIPSIIKAVDDNQAALIMLNTNLNQRDELLPSEKAFAYKMQMDTMKQQGKRTDLTLYPMEIKLTTETLSPMGTKLDTGNKIAQDSKDTRTNIFRYIRLTSLIPALLDRVDNGEMPFRAGVNLSYLTERQQDSLLDYVDTYKLKVSLEQSEKLKDAAKLSEPEGFRVTSLDELFGRAPKQKPSPSPVGKAFKAASIRVEQYFEGKNKDQIEAILVEAVQRYFESNP